MKKKIVFLSFFLYVIVFFNPHHTFSQQQNKFIIGADWLNPTWPTPNLNYSILSPNYWNLIEELGVNYGALNIGYNQPNGETMINTELTNAALKHMEIILYTYQLDNAQGRRWMYQIEEVEGNNDFGSRVSGIGLNEDPNNGIPEIHWSKKKINEQVPNFWRLITGIHQAGYVAENVVEDDLQADSSWYYISLGVRKRAQIHDDTPILKIWIINKNHPDLYYTYLLKASDCQNEVWQEKEIGHFYKTPSYPTNPIIADDHIVLEDTLGITGIEDYKVTTAGYTPYEIKVEWYGTISCDLDYLIIEDLKSKNLQAHNYDNILQQMVSEFADKPGLGNFKIWDEPTRANLLSTRYMQRKLDSYLGPGLVNKNAFTFHPGIWNSRSYSSPQQYLAQSEIYHLVSDIYPIDLDTPIPGEINYNSDIQSQFNEFLIKNNGYYSGEGLLREIEWATTFQQPFWYTAQTHEWNIPPDQQWKREPSAYEIRATVNLGVCYGAKGIIYFMFAEPKVLHLENGTYVLRDAGETLLQNDNINNPAPRYTDYYGYPKWETVRQLNHKLVSIGPELITLTWQNAIYIPDGQPINEYITNVQSYNNSIPDPSTSTYVQLGLFKKTDDPNNNNLEHFFIVNRRTLPDESRSIRININKSGAGNLVN